MALRGLNDTVVGVDFVEFVVVMAVTDVGLCLPEGREWSVGLVGGGGERCAGVRNWSGFPWV